MTETNRKLFLIRHSAVSLDPAVTSSEWRLSDDGRSRCLQLANWLAHSYLDVIVTSHEPKAVETGQILANALNLPWQTAANLHEHDRRGMPVLASQAEFRAAVRKLLTHQDQLVMGRETAVQAKERFVAAVDAVLNDHPSGNVAIVSHGTVMTLLLCHFNPHLKPVPLWKSLTLPCLFELTLPSMKLLGEWKYAAE